MVHWWVGSYIPTLTVKGFFLCFFPFLRVLRAVGYFYCPSIATASAIVSNHSCEFRDAVPNRAVVYFCQFFIGSLW